jgi:hypothetical protein
MNNQILFIIIQFIHVLVITFTLFGCFLPLKYLKYHLFMFPIIYTQWQLNNQKCILNDFESYFNNNSEPLWTDIQKYINTYNISNDQVTIIFLLLLISGFSISCVRLYKNY